jgi:hypothetical protein
VAVYVLIVASLLAMLLTGGAVEDQKSRDLTGTILALPAGQTKRMRGPRTGAAAC